MKDFKIMEVLKKQKYKKVLIFLLNFILLYGILITAVLPEKYSLKQGDIARIDIKAPRDVEDVLSTKNKKEAVLRTIPEQYTLKSDVKSITIKSIENIFHKVLETNNENFISNSSTLESTNDGQAKIDENKIKELRLNKLKNELKLGLSNENYTIFLNLTPNQMGDLKEELIDVISRLYDEYQINSEKGKQTTLDDIEELEKKQKTTEKEKVHDVIPFDEKDKKNLQKNVYLSEDNIRLEDKRKAKNFIDFEFSKLDLSKKIKELGRNIGYTQIRANIVYDEVKTQQLKSEALKSSEPVVIKKDQLIIREGEPVTKAEIEVLRELGFLNEKNNFQWYIYISLAIFIFVGIFIEGFYIYKYHEEIYNNDKKIILISIINIFSVILARSIYFASPYLIPLACAPMLITLLISDNVAITMSIMNAIFVSAAVNFNVPITILAIINSVIGAVLLRNMDERSDILYSALYIAGVNTVLVLVLGFLQSNNNLVDVFTKGAMMFVASILAGVLTIGLLPFFESIFDIVTTVKLLELSNPNQPLLKRLLIEAPGTYHHSVLVANLSELAAEAVGANSVLARVASYYHDVGKIKRPYFFKENQLGNDNPHNKITPNLSTLIITSHVKDGVELAKQYKIPKDIRDIIEQHHGTSLVKYFYVTMKNSSERPEDIKEEDFRYLGPIPETKEAAIIMLADAVEAAVRSISEPTKGKIEEMVNNIIKDRLNEGQLDNCDLTLKDINKIRKAFLKVLTGIYHQRIEYPEDKWANKQGV